MTKIDLRTTREKLAAIIVAALEKNGLSAVLVGGAVVSIYTNNKYESFDLDFISPDDPAKIDAVMLALGFKRSGKDFRHPKTKLFVEFPGRTLSIGETHNVKAEGRLKVGGTTIVLYSPTQCVMDRLAAYFHWNDTESLEQAVLVANDQKIDLKEIEKWARNEGEPDKFERFRRRVLGNKR